jgi:HAD superfamily hydrolase (TIGR01509 family)
VESKPREGSQAEARRRVRAVIFDLDGVLVWSVPMHWHAFRTTFLGEGREFSLEEYRRVALGAAREEVIRSVLGDVSPEDLNRLMAEKQRHVEEYLGTKGIDLIPGSLDFVRAVRARGRKTAVASASRTPEIVLRSIEAISLFDAIVGRAEVARSKPHPDLYLAAALRLETEPEDCLVIEDSPVGVEAALEAGMRVLALTTTEHRTALSRATAVFGGYAEIPLDEFLFP